MKCPCPIQRTLESYDVEDNAYFYAWMKSKGSHECMADANARIRRSPNGRESVVMYTNADWNHLREEHEIAYLRADICLGSPQSYSLEEKRQICEDMDASTKAIDAAMRADF